MFFYRPDENTKRTNDSSERCYDSYSNKPRATQKILDRLDKVRELIRGGKTFGEIQAAKAAEARILAAYEI